MVENVAGSLRKKHANGFKEDFVVGIEPSVICERANQSCAAGVIRGRVSEELQKAKLDFGPRRRTVIAGHSGVAETEAQADYTEVEIRIESFRVAIRGLTAVKTPAGTKSRREDTNLAGKRYRTGSLRMAAASASLITPRLTSRRIRRCAMLARVSE